MLLKSYLIFTLLALIICTNLSYSQVLTSEDSLNAGVLQKDKATVFSGYGEMKVNYDMRLKTANANITRAVLFLGHKFSSSVALFTEIELEDARISEGEAGGELSLEQLYLKFNINRDHYIVGGLFLPRIGIINENHLPTTFHGNDRPFTEQYVIPSTWREIGVGIYGAITSVKGLNYSFAITNGLNSAAFVNGTGIRNGRYNGKNATYTNLSVTGALLYYTGNFRFQASGYYGGSAGISQREADSLFIDNSTFGTPVALTEANVRYSTELFSVTALASFISISDAEEINRAYANNTPESIVGTYAEASINILKLFNSSAKKTLDYFIRYEWMDLNQSIPTNGIINDANQKSFLVTGIDFTPVPGVIIKADYVFRKTGEQNDQLIINPYPQAPPYYTENGFFNIGFGYSF